jgi:hypothetical protein
MEETVKIRIDQSQQTVEATKKFFGRGKPATTHYFVHLKVELTNEEKAIIHQYNLGEVVIDEYTDTSVINPLIDEYNATPPFDEKKRASLKYKIDLFSDPIKLTLSQFVAQEGFNRNFSSLREATDYAQQLKTKILPQIKQTIEHYSVTGGKSSDTFEL